MKVLVVCTYRSYAAKTEYMAPFVYEQIQNLRKRGIDISLFQVKGGGLKAYLKAIPELRKQIRRTKANIVHAHYGLCGTIAVLASLWIKTCRTMVTYHGSDINNKSSRILSWVALHCSDSNIFVSQKLYDKAVYNQNMRDKSIVIPCGVDTELFHPMDRSECRKHFNMEKEKRYILFSKMFNITVKNYPLAKAAVDKLENAELVEFSGYSREDAVKLMNACDCAVMTSFTEGSPQFVKEAVACGCPVVSVDVGDVRNIVTGTNNCIITGYDAERLAEAMTEVIQTGHSDNIQLGNSYKQQYVISQILDIYKELNHI